MGLIQKLSADVVNRIAAGEVVQRPSAALKELLENALDAGSGSIQVSAGEGGLQSLEVSDDGSGIFKDDLPLLCERYATSKLRCFEDLQQVASFGFRGEALASLSYVSRVTVVTRRRDSDAAKGSHVAWRCRYMDGKLLGEGEGDGGGAQACAGNFGTTIRAEKMFYNAAVRRQAIRPSEEWGRIVDVVGRYALAFPHVAFSCKREGGSSSASAQSLAFPRDSTVLKNIRIMFGNAVASHLRLIYYYKDHQGDENKPLLSTSTVDSAPASCEVSVKPLGDEDILSRVRHYSNTLRSSSVHGSTEEAYSIAGYTSDATLANRKTFLCVFVNQRLVESSAIRRAVDSAYAAALAGTGNKPFTVLFLTVPAQRVDVNVHPTKQEVCLLDEELILARLVELIRGALLAAAGSRQMDWMKMSSTAVVALKEFERKGGGGAEGGSGCPQMESSSLPVLRQLQTDMRVNGNHGLLPNQSASVVPPSMTIRVEPQKGALDRFFHSRAGVEAVGSGTEDAAPVPLPHNDKERCDCESSEDESEKQEVGLLSKSGVEAHSVNTLPPTITGLIPSVPTVLNLDEEEEEDDVMGDFKRFRREGPASSAPGGEEWAAAPESPSQQQDGTTADGMDLNGTEGMRSTLGVSSIVEVPELEDQVLTSVAAIAEEIQQSSNATAELLVRELSFVGVLDRHSCLAQSGTNLLLLDLRSMAREVVYQRIFLRWVDPTLPKAGSVQMQPPLALQELLFAALQHDSDAMTPHSDELAAVLCEMRVGGGMDACSDQTACSLPPKTSTYLRRLSRRLCRWREMLAEYYGIVLSSEGFLLKLPYGMNSSWHPFLRAVPLLMWMLAERVPYPRSGDGAVVEEGSPLSGVEAKCFKSIAAHISDVLYGLQTPSIAGLPDGSPVLSDAVQFGLLPCLRNQSLFAAPAAWLHDGTIQPVVSVDSLYKVFERC